jgi:hypothetical protein
VTIRLIQDLPFFDEATTTRIPGGPVVSILHNQIILWVSVTPHHSPYDREAELPQDKHRISALLDTGFNDCFLVNERHLTD